jgi:hypothetical protein
MLFVKAIACFNPTIHVFLSVTMPQSEESPFV